LPILETLLFDLCGQMSEKTPEFAKSLCGWKTVDI
jgi:hypothetical protein